MKIGDIPISEMTFEQKVEVIAKLQSAREALRAEGVAKKREREAPKPKVERNVEAKEILGNVMDILRGK